MNTAQLEVGVMEVLAEHPYCTTDQLADRLQVSSTLLAVVLRELEGLLEEYSPRLGTPRGAGR